MQQPMQLKPHTVQSPHTTQTGQLHGGSHSGQGGSHGHHGQGGLHKQSPNTTTRHQHLQSSQQGSNQPTQKQTHHPSQEHKTNRRSQHQ